MNAWKRRLTMVVAVLGSAGLLMSAADAREPRDRDPIPPPTLSPDFSFPTVTFPPPPTMPPPTTSTTGPPPTMPPPGSSTTSPPPTMPPTIPSDIDDEIETIIDRLEQFGDDFADLIDELRDVQASL